MTMNISIIEAAHAFVASHYTSDMLSSVRLFDEAVMERDLETALEIFEGMGGNDFLTEQGYFKGSVHKMPASIDDVRGQMLYLYIHQGMTQMLDEIEARIGTRAAPVYSSVYKAGFGAQKLFEPHITKSGREAVQLWLDANKKAGFDLYYASHTARVMRKYKNDIRNERVKSGS